MKKNDGKMSSSTALVWVGIVGLFLLGIDYSFPSTKEMVLFALWCILGVYFLVYWFRVRKKKREESKVK